MVFVANFKITEKLVNLFHEEMNIELAIRLEDDNYVNPFEGFKDWHFLKPKAIKKIDLTTNYIYLLDKEPFNEN